MDRFCVEDSRAIRKFIRVNYGRISLRFRLNFLFFVLKVEFQVNSALFFLKADINKQAALEGAEPNFCKKMERVTGVEPARPAWKAD